MGEIKDAVAALAAGDWQAAHAIAQRDASPNGCWAHGVAHLLEGDRANAAYWYRRAGRDLPAPDAINAEIAALRAAIE